MLKISILTLFPEMFIGPFDHSIIKRAREKNLVEIDFVNIRNFGIGKHKMVDDKPYGGGIGMIMKVDVLHDAIEKTKNKNFSNEEQKVVLLDARGKTFQQGIAREFSCLKHLILLCGHYEGVDERIREFVDETISIGDYIVTGGEIPAMAIVDATVRLLPEVLKQDATTYESFRSWSSLSTMSSRSNGQDDSLSLEYPQYTTPREFKGKKVPEILLSGDHKKIENWKKEKSEEITKKYRKDLLENI